MIRKHRIVILGAGLVLALGFAALVAVVAQGSGQGRRAQSSGTKLALAELLNRGRRAALSSRMRDQLRTADLGGTPSVMGRSGDRTFYRIDGTIQGTCFASSRSAASGFGLIRCPPDGFPTPQNPLLDFSIESIDPVSNAVTMYSSQGLAADGVSEVAIVGTGGAPIATTRVIQNMYSFAKLPQEAVIGIQARDGSGRVLYTLSF